MIVKSQKYPATRSLNELGVTLMELMIIVIIMGVLTTAAIRGYHQVIHQSRYAEAKQMLGMIRAAQGAYYQTFNQYAGEETYAVWPEGELPKQNKLEWGTPTSQTWLHLGVRAQSAVWFQYRIRASIDPATADSEVFQDVPSGPWFQAQALEDFDGDGIPHYFEVTSHTPHIYEGRGN